MPNIKALFGDCPHIVEIEKIFKSLAAGQHKDQVLHSVTKLGKNLNGVHRNQLVDLAYAELERRKAPADGNRLVSSGRAS